MALADDAALHRLAQVEHGADLVGLHPAGGNAGPALDDLGDRLAVDHGEDQRLFALQRAGALKVPPAWRDRPGRRLPSGVALSVAVPPACRRGRLDLSRAPRRSRSRWRVRPPSAPPAWPARRWSPARRSGRRVASAWSGPAVISRSTIFSSVSIRPMRRWRSSIGAGIAVWLIATRAQAVSSRLTALSGSWRRRDVAGRQPHRLAHRLVEDAHLVVLFEDADQAADHRDGDLFARLLDLHHLEAPGRARRPSRSISCTRPRWSRRWCASSPRASAGFSRLAASFLPGRAAGADHRVRFVDEQDDRLGAGLDLFDHRLQAVLELALHARAGLQQAEIEGAQRHVAQRRRHVAGGDAQREAFDDGGLADARLAGEDRVVLPAARQDVDDLPDLEVAAEDRVDLAGLGLRGQVDRELVERPPPPAARRPSPRPPPLGPPPPGGPPPPLPVLAQIAR